MKLKKFICLLLAIISLLSLNVIANAEDKCATVTANDTSTSYSSFEEAWNKAVELGNTSEVTFTLNNSWKADGSGYLGSGSGFTGGALTYSGKNNLTIDLNGYTIDRNLFKSKDGGAVIYVKSQMTIIDSRKDEYTVSKLFKGGAIENGANDERGGGIVISDNSTLNFNGGTILNCVSTDDGGAISIVGSGANLIVNGGSFYGNRTYEASGECCGGAIYTDEATVKISNSTFEGNYAEDNGGAIYADDGTVSITDSTFYSNSSLEEGGAIFADGDVKTTITNCTFTNNSSTNDDGGAIYCDSGEGTYLNNCQMLYNYSGSEGGAVYINDDKIFVLGGNYQHNTAKDNGGGIYVDSMNDINVSGKLIIKDNTVSDKENDLCLQDGTASTAYLYCGGLYEGSSVYLCSNSKSSHLVIKGIDKFQYNNYIHYDDGFTLSKVNQTSLSSDNTRAVASAIGDGSVVFICIAFVFIIFIAIIFMLITKKKKGARTDG